MICRLGTPTIDKTQYSFSLEFRICRSILANKNNDKEPKRISTTTKATMTFDQYGYLTHLVEDVKETDDLEMHLLLNYEWSD